MYICENKYTRNFPKSSIWRNKYPLVFVMICKIFCLKIVKDTFNGLNVSGNIWDTLHDLATFMQFKKREKLTWVLLKVTLPCVFFTFLKLYKWYQIAQSIAFFAFEAINI